MPPPKTDVLEVLDNPENLYELQSTEIKRPAPPKSAKAGRLVTPRQLCSASIFHPIPRNG
jgi:hypothetical protein